MAIYLDTNILPQPPSPLLTTTVTVIRALAHEHQTLVVLPELVVEESVSARRRALEDACRDLVNAARHLEEFEAFTLPALPEPDAHAETWRQSLIDAFEIAPTPPDAGTEALRREGHRLAPARDGSGARDAGIWLTVLSHHLALNEEGYFVSENTSDFADASDRSRFHPQLAAELPADHASLSYCPSVAALLEGLAEQAAFDVALETMSDSERVSQAVALALQTTPVVQVSDVHSQRGIGAPYVAGPITSQPIRLFDSRSFTVGAVTIAVTRSRWSFEFPLGYLRRHVGGGFAEEVYYLSGEANLNLLLRLTADGSIDSADVMGISAIRIAA